MKFTYSITTTLGPASAAEATWERLIGAGATAFRLNTSHLSIEELGDWLERLQAFFTRRGGCIPVILDLQGSKWRLGKFTPFALVEGQRIKLACCAAVDQPAVLPVPHPDFFSAAAVSGVEIVLNDAKIRLRLESTGVEEIEARVVSGGLISPNKGITYVASDFRQETLSEKDSTILAQTAGLDFLRFAISYVKDVLETRNFRQQVDLIYHDSMRKPYLIAKLERQPAVDQANAIAQWVDELWLCRGDLGAELGIPGMAAAAFQFTRRVREIPVPAVLAGQVLEHMVSSQAPTRSEVYTIYEALMMGYSGLVLSDEVAIGRFPVESCQAAGMFMQINQEEQDGER